jgi:hypothetical protein
LVPDSLHASHDDVIHGFRVDMVTFDHCAEHLRGEIDWVPAGQIAAALAARCADCIDDDG